MAYEKQTWQTGDTITADKLNHIESGIEGASGVLIVTETDDVEHAQMTLNKTWQEIYDAVISGKQIFLDNSVSAGSGNISLRILIDIYTVNDSGQYSVLFSNADGYHASSADSYPSYYYGD